MIEFFLILHFFRPPSNHDRDTHVRSSLDCKLVLPCCRWIVVLSFIFHYKVLQTLKFVWVPCFCFFAAKPGECISFKQFSIDFALTVFQFFCHSFNFSFAKDNKNVVVIVVLQKKGPMRFLTNCKDQFNANYGYERMPMHRT